MRMYMYGLSTKGVSNPPGRGVERFGGGGGGYRMRIACAETSTRQSLGQNGRTRGRRSRDPQKWRLDSLSIIVVVVVVIIIIVLRARDARG